MQLARIQKERDQFSDELETLKERSESSQTLLMKAARDREAMQTDLEVLKERYEKSHAIQQKLQVIFSMPLMTQQMQINQRMRYTLTKLACYQNLIYTKNILSTLN